MEVSNPEKQLMTPSANPQHDGHQPLPSLPWFGGVIVVNGVNLINEVNQRQARLVLGIGVLLRL